MSDRVIEWWWRRTGGPERPVVLAGLTVRTAGLAILCYAIPLSWTYFPHPLWSVFLGAVLTVHAALTAAWWLRRREIERRTLLVDLPVGAAAQLVGAALAFHGGDPGWTDFAFPYSVLASVVLGLASRSWWDTIGAGLVWGGGQLAASALLDRSPVEAVLFVVPSFLVGPVVGWTSARLLRRSAAELDAETALAVRRAAELATVQERSRHAQALHDRVLQTLETLARDGAVADPVLAERVATEAGWLRRFVEGGAVDQREDLVSALAATARAVERGGVDLQLNDASLRSLSNPGQVLSGESRELLLAALYQTMVALTSAPAVHGGRSGIGPVRLVVRAALERGGLLVTVLSRGARGPADLEELDGAQATLRRVGGDLRVDPEPYAELWVPASGAPGT